MSPITHFLAGWSIAEAGASERRERFWICLAGLAPDLDGFGLGMDIANEILGRAPTQWYASYHHFLFHGLFGALVTVALARLGGVRRAKALVLIFCSFHLHLLCDLVGARGPASYDIWVVHYLGPFTRAGTLWWSHQWPLNGWQNFLITVGLIGGCLARAVSGGTSPLSLFSSATDAVVVGALRERWARLRGTGTQAAGDRG